LDSKETNQLTIENLNQAPQITNKQENPQKDFIDVSEREKGSNISEKEKVIKF